jgi:hypothetical protein
VPGPCRGRRPGPAWGETLDVLADVAGHGKAGGVTDGQGQVERLGESLDLGRLSDPGRADQEHVALPDRGAPKGRVGVPCRRADLIRVSASFEPLTQLAANASPIRTRRPPEGGDLQPVLLDEPGDGLNNRKLPGLIESWYACPSHPRPGAREGRRPHPRPGDPICWTSPSTCSRIARSPRAPVASAQAGRTISDTAPVVKCNRPALRSWLLARRSATIRWRDGALTSLGVNDRGRGADRRQ